MGLSDIARYGLWAGIVGTANANRRHYKMPTTWIPHLLMNTVTLLLPDVYRLATAGNRGSPQEAAASAVARSTTLHVLHQTTLAMVRDNPRYVVYVAPLAIGYLASHPKFNIYKGAWAEKELAGLGLDALPHGATAFALTALVEDTLETATRFPSDRHQFDQLIGWCHQHRGSVSLAVLAMVTLVWELGEYQIHQQELAQRGDSAAINMQWSPRDTVQDCVANVLGWAFAVGYSRLTQHGGRQHPLDHSAASI